MTTRVAPLPGRSAQFAGGPGSLDVRDGAQRQRRSAAVSGPGGTAETAPDGPLRMALDGLARAFEEAERGRDWFAMKTQLRRVDDAVQAVWYAAKVRGDDGT